MATNEKKGITVNLDGVHHIGNPIYKSMTNNIQTPA